jgi:ribosomal-protein-alanine N-acetyltransferase
MKMFGNIPGLSTKRLKLRKIYETDLEELFVICSSPIVSEQMTWGTHTEKETTKSFIDYLICQYEIGESADWGIEFNNKLVGMCSFINWSEVDHSAELGYFIGHDYWRMGIAKEAVTELIRYAFKTVELNRIEACCNDSNIASEKVMQSVGMIYEGTLREDRIIKGIIRNTKVYSILRKEFSRFKEGSYIS